MQDERDACERVVQWQGEMQPGFDREVVPLWRTGAYRLPVKREVNRQEAFREVSG